MQAEGYREVFKALVLAEAAHEREPGNLAVSDDLVRVLLAASPIGCYDPETKTFAVDQDLWSRLQKLRAGDYARTRDEVEHGRPFTWADFARTADYAYLFSRQDPARAAEALEWGIAAGGGPNGDNDRQYLNGVVGALKTGDGCKFMIYSQNGMDYPHDYIYGRRLPSFHGPTGGGRSYEPMLAVGQRRGRDAYVAAGALPPAVSNQ